jgi:hypothetical protein
MARTTLNPITGRRIKKNRPCGRASAFFTLLISYFELRPSERFSLQPHLSAIAGLKPKGFKASFEDNQEGMSRTDASKLDRHIKDLLKENPTAQFIDFSICEQYNKQNPEGFAIFNKWYTTAMNNGLRSKIGGIMASPRVKELTELMEGMELQVCSHS